MVSARDLPYSTKAMVAILTAGMLCAFASVCRLEAHQPSTVLEMGTGTGLPGLLAAALIFNAADRNHDGAVTIVELKTTMEDWFSNADVAHRDSVSEEQLIPVLDEALPKTMLPRLLMGSGAGGAQPQTADTGSLHAMMAALPDQAPAKPVRPRKVLVLAKASGFVHSSIPLAAKTVEALGEKTGAWATTITYDSADITADNLRHYDAVVLASTTGEFLDDVSNPAGTASRRKALLEFVRAGRGLVGLHAATDSYHKNVPTNRDVSSAGTGIRDQLSNFSIGRTLAPVLMSNGDSDGNGRLSRAEVDALADKWFKMLDSKNTGKLLQSDFALLALLIPRPAVTTPVGAQMADSQMGTWPDFNRMIGGYFKWHWFDPQLITVKLDDPTSPLTAMFKGKEFEIRDEIYTMGVNSWSRDNLHVLTSIDYAKMSTEDRAQEEYPRADHDYGLSWIRREGRGRVFYEALGHSERNYSVTPLLEQILAGIQYAIGDLKADDSPSNVAKAGRR